MKTVTWDAVKTRSLSEVKSADSSTHPHARELTKQNTYCQLNCYIIGLQNIIKPKTLFQETCHRDAV